MVQYTSYVGLSALLVSTFRAMREPLLSGTSKQAGSTFLYVYANEPNTINICHEELGAGKKIIYEFTRKKSKSDC